jgi:hypothetical protein
MRLEAGDRARQARRARRDAEELSAGPQDRPSMDEVATAAVESKSGGREVDLRRAVGRPDTPAYQLEISWPEAQKLRADLGLPPKKLHVSLSGGIGDAVRARDAAGSVPPGSP